MEVGRAGQGWGVNEGLHLGYVSLHICVSIRMEMAMQVFGGEWEVTEVKA